jgi:hypothetical protein
MNETEVATAIIKYNSTATKSFGFLSIYGWFSVTEWLAIIGAALAIISFVYDVYNKRKTHRRLDRIAAENSALAQAEERRKQAEHEVKMQLLREA